MTVAPSSRRHDAHCIRLVITALAIQSRLHRSQRLGNWVHYRHDRSWRSLLSGIRRLGEVLRDSGILALQVPERPDHHRCLPAIRNHVPLYLVNLPLLLQITSKSIISYCIEPC